MRSVHRTVEGRFDAVIAFDDSVPHLLSDADITAALRGFRDLLAPGGTILLSVRDYDEVDRSPTSTHRYGERVRRGTCYRMSQEWEWYDPSHYRTTMVVEQREQGGWKEIVRTVTAYYAIPVQRLLQLPLNVGLTAHRVEEEAFFQPVLRGELPSSER
jgi:hypothetical protein